MLKVKIHQKLLILWIKMLIENFFLVLDFLYLTNNFQNPKSDMFYHQKKEIFQNLMPNRCYFSTMALDLIFGPKCLLTQILEYHVFTKIFHCAPWKCFFLFVILLSGVYCDCLTSGEQYYPNKSWKSWKSTRALLG